MILSSILGGLGAAALVLYVVLRIVIESQQEYKAEKYARRKVTGQAVSWIDFMCSRHPWIVTGGVFLLIALVIGSCSSK